MDAEKLPKTLRRWAPMISDISDERDSGDGYWVNLKCGWWLPDYETHSAHEDNVKECARALRYIAPCAGKCGCDCSICKPEVSR